METLTVKVIKHCLFSDNLICSDGSGLILVGLLPSERDRLDSLVGRNVSFRGDWIHEQAEFRAHSYEVCNG